MSVSTRSLLALAVLAVGFPAQPATAQERTDAQLLASFRTYWQQIDRELTVAGTDCERLVARLDAWHERVGEAADSLIAESQGLPDRLSDQDMARLQPMLEPLMQKMADAGANCLNHPRYMEVMRPVNVILSMGG